MAAVTWTPITKMNEYRAYIIGQDGHIFRRIELICADDKVAKEQAKLLVASHDVELWQLDRQIEVFKHEGPRPPRANRG
jgi:hypothetical protein